MATKGLLEGAVDGAGHHAQLGDVGGDGDTDFDGDDSGPGALAAIRVRMEGGKLLGRGEQALIVDYDAERESYLVEPMRDVLADKS